MEKKQQHTHTVMSKKLADALMEAGVHHFDAGGVAEANGGRGSQVTSDLGVSDQSVVGQFGSGMDQLMGFNNYSASAPEISRQNFIPEYLGQRNRGNMADNLQDIEGQRMLAQANGQGPNPAQAQLQQQTGQNVQQQAALMAGQRGASANPALMARQAAMQGANIQQQAVGQANTLAAQQQLAASNQYQQILQNRQQNSLQAQGILQGANAAQNTAITQGSLGAQNINSNVSGQNSQHQGQMLGSIMNGLSGVMGAEGGEVPHFDEGGDVGEANVADYSAPGVDEPSMTPFTAFDAGQKKGGGGGGMMGGLMKMLPMLLALNEGGIANYSAPVVEGVGLTPYGAFKNAEAEKKKKKKGQSGDPNNIASPNAGGGEGYSGTEMAGGAGDVMENSSGSFAEGIGGALLAAVGGSIPGQAAVKGNSLKNDKVPALLSPGEIVLPRSVTQSPDMEKKAIEFLRHLKSNKKGYGGVLDSRKSKMACGGKV